MLNDLSMSVSVKVPKEIKAAAKELPEFSAVGNRLTAATDAMNITMQTVVVGAVLGLIIATLLLREKGR